MRCDEVWLCRQIADAINKDERLGESGIRAEYFDYGTKVLLSHVETEQPFATLTFKKEVV